MLAFAAPVTPRSEKANSVPLARADRDLANRPPDQNGKCFCKRKSMENMAVVLSNFGTKLNRLPFAVLRAAT
ncbi:MAG: hypothetical protein DME45_01170 [Verrucomicrobia bacterium]|nr:MAG: hypothetical protein DME45_01170 [Verrucomicrobiota bacterium]